MAAAKLERDLATMAAMAAEMDSYLRSDVLFWPMATPDMPQLTLGGYLLRQHRLLALRDGLDTAEKALLAATVAQFEEVLGERIVRTEQKAHQEMDARIRQWREYLAEVRREYDATIPSYATAVAARAMLAAMLRLLESPPYQLNRTVRQRVSQLDMLLQARWEKGAFVWEDGWQPAYPPADYWWLYGRPKRPPESK